MVSFREGGSSSQEACRPKLLMNMTILFSSEMLARAPSWMWPVARSASNVLDMMDETEGAMCSRNAA